MIETNVKPAFLYPLYDVNDMRVHGNTLMMTVFLVFSLNQRYGEDPRILRTLPRHRLTSQFTVRKVSSGKD